MAHALTSVHEGPVTGLVIGTHGEAPSGLVWHESAHPVPDQRSQHAARAALALARSRQIDDRFTVLVSGGASSLMALAADGVAFEDKQAVVGRLLTGGADITALNCVRKHLSAIKGGRLAQACRGPVDAWLLSDVVGDDPSVIGSGPTVPDPTTFVDALDVLDRFGGPTAYPPAVVAHLRAGAAGRVAETPKAHADLARVTTRVVGSAAHALDGAEAAARARGYEVVRRATPITGEARDAARAHVDWIEATVRVPGRKVCVLASGETTVHVTGSAAAGGTRSSRSPQRWRSTTGAGSSPVSAPMALTARPRRRGRGSTIGRSSGPDAQGLTRWRIFLATTRGRFSAALADTSRRDPRIPTSATSRSC